MEEKIGSVFDRQKSLKTLRSTEEMYEKSSFVEHCSYKKLRKCTESATYVAGFLPFV
jgi:hypothetical protein